MRRSAFTVSLAFVGILVSACAGCAPTARQVASGQVSVGPTTSVDSSVSADTSATDDYADDYTVKPEAKPKKDLSGQIKCALADAWGSRLAHVEVCLVELRGYTDVGSTAYTYWTYWGYYQLRSSRTKVWLDLSFVDDPIAELHDDLSGVMAGEHRLTLDQMQKLIGAWGKRHSEPMGEASNLAEELKSAPGSLDPRLSGLDPDNVWLVSALAPDLKAEFGGEVLGLFAFNLDPATGEFTSIPGNLDEP